MLLWKIVRRLEELGHDYWQATDTVKWLDLYTDQKTLVLEEFRSSSSTLQNML